MAPKTKSRTAVWFFAKECMDTGKIRASSVKDAIEAIYPEWKAMVAHEKGPYEKMCEKWRNEIKLEKSIFTKVKINETHEDVEGIKEQEDLAKLLSNLASIKNENGRSMDGIRDQNWFIIQFQTFCKSEINPDPDDIYKPYFVLGEIALIEYSLREGIINEYHSFIKPNKIPLGYTSQCMDKSKEDHQIPLHGFDQVKKSYSQIYTDIKRFVKQQGDYEVPVFCMEKDIEASRFGLKYLYNNTPSNDIFSFNKIYSLENLIVNLAKYCGMEYSFESAHDLLKSYTFDYTQNSRCEFHEELSVTHCSLGIVKKYTYLISDNICQFYDIDLTPKHIPIQKSVGTIICNVGETSYRNSSDLSGSRSSKRYIDYQEENKQDTKKWVSSFNSKNTSANDTRKRQLVSDKLETSVISSISSSINIDSRSKYNQYNKGNSNCEIESFASESINTNAFSSLNMNRFQNVNEELLEEDDEDDTWTKVEKPSRSNQNSIPTSADKFSNFSSNMNSSSRSFRGRGRALSSGRY